jgi:hypothetical protein
MALPTVKAPTPGRESSVDEALSTNSEIESNPTNPNVPGETNSREKWLLQYGVKWDEEESFALHDSRVIRRISGELAEIRREFPEMDAGPTSNKMVWTLHP